MMNGDILTTIDFHRFFSYGCAQDGDLTIATKKIRTPFNFGSVETSGDRVIKVEEKPDFLIEIVAGIYFMRPALLDLVPNDQYFGIDSLIGRMLADGRTITRYLMEEYWLDIGRVEDYREAEEAYRVHFIR
jgi:NDP-sugar pyrophosphorylase family protein